MANQDKNINNQNRSDFSENLTLELRRGVLVLAVLSQLKEKEYGYSLKQRLIKEGLDIHEGTLYPLMRRLESQGLLTSEWQVVNEKRPRRYYCISQDGEKVLNDLSHNWEQLKEVMSKMLSRPEENENERE